MDTGVIERQIRALGFSETEASVYVQLLCLSPAQAALIAKKTGIPRSSVYLAMNELFAKGLVSVTFKNGVRQFIAEDPKVLKELLEQEQQHLSAKMQVAEGLVESLRVLQKSDIHIPNIVFFEGQESLKKIYLGMLREARDNSTMLIIRDEFVWDPAWEFIFQEEWNDLVRRLRTEKNIATRLIINDSREERKHGAYYRSRKAFALKRLPPKHAVHDFAIYILNDITSILSMEKNNVIGIKITNEHITRNFRELFESLWAKKK